MLLKWIKSKYLSFRASLITKHRTREVVRVMTLAHASELAHTPVEQWPAVRTRQGLEIAAVLDGKFDITDRRSWVYPYLPETLHRLKQPIIKNTPYNIRRFSRTPVPRRAINLIKSAITSLDWDIVPKEGTENDITDDQKVRAKRAKECFSHPNNTESFFQFQEEGIDDLCVNGAFCIEPQLTPNPERPFKMWTVDSTTIRMFADWKESTQDQPHYAQMTGLKGERGIIVFYDDELVYIKDNPQVDSPFGLGKMEVGFQAINSFLGVQEMSGRAGADQIHKTWLWWPQAQKSSDIDIIRRHIMNDLEGQSKVSLIAGMQQPQVIDINPVTIDDLLMPWQEFLLRVIACAFDLSAMALNLERDVNRSTGEVLDDKDFRSAVVPIAKKLEDHYTNFLLHRLLGWKDLKFTFLNMDDPDAETKMAINQQLYACNAVTPNDILKSMGMPPSASEFAKLTQFESILTLQMATQAQQQQQADQQFQRQAQMMQQYGPAAMMPQGQPGQPGAPGGGGAPGGAPGGGGPPKIGGGMKPPTLGKPPSLGAAAKPANDSDTIKAPKTGSTGNTGKGPKATGIAPVMPKLKMPTMPKLPKLSLPKTPIAGSVYNAEQIASMSAEQVAQETQQGKIPADKQQVTKSMQQQEPNILEQLSDDLKQYFEVVEDNQKEDTEDDEPDVTPEEEEEQLQRFKDFQHIPPEIERVFNKGVEKSPALSKLRITRTTSHKFNGPNVDKAFRKGKPYVGDVDAPKQKVSRSGGAATGTGFEEDHNPPPNGYPGRKKRREPGNQRRRK